VLLLARCISDDDNEIEAETYIENAVRFYLAEHQVGSSVTYSDNGSSVRKHFTLYTSLEEFMSENPDCCIFSYRGPEGYVPPLWQRLFYSYEGVVMMNNYRLRIVGEGDVREPGLGFAIPMNSSAEPLRINGYNGD